MSDASSAGRQLSSIEGFVASHVPWATLSPFGTRHFAHVVRALQCVSSAVTRAAPSDFYTPARDSGLQFDKLFGPLPLETVQHAASQPHEWWQATFSSGSAAKAYWPLFVRTLLWRAGIEPVRAGDRATATTALHQAALSLYLNGLAPMARHLGDQLATQCVFDMDTRLCRRRSSSSGTAAHEPPHAMRDMLHEQLRALGGNPLHSTMGAVARGGRDGLPEPEHVTQATLCGVALGQLDTHVPHAEMEHLLHFGGPPRVLVPHSSTALTAVLHRVAAECGPRSAAAAAAAVAKAGEAAWQAAGNSAPVGVLPAQDVLELVLCLAELRAHVDPETLMHRLWAPSTSPTEGSE